MKLSTREWISKAEADYQLALVLSRLRKVTFHDHACFHCQQSAARAMEGQRPADKPAQGNALGHDLEPAQP